MRIPRSLCPRWLCAAGIVAVLSILAPTAGASAQQAAGDTVVPYTGTAYIGAHQWLGPLHPPQAAPYMDDTVVRIHFAVQDDAHYRIDLQTLAPALDAGTETVVMNGGTLDVYDARSNTAAEYTVPSSQFQRYFVQFMSGNAEAPGQGAAVLPVLPDPAQPLSAYLDALRLDPFSPDIHHAAALAGTDTVLGRPTAVINYGPIYLDESSCLPGTGSSCLDNAPGLGSAQLWVDADHPILLQYREDIPTSIENKPGIVSHLFYQVTALTIGQGPSAADLQFAPPVPVTRSAAGPGTDSWPGDYSTTPPPSPFIVLPDPSGMTVACRNWEADTSFAGPSPILLASLFTTTRPVNGCQNPAEPGPYLLVLQRLQAHGLPAGLEPGTPALEGNCAVWSGTYPDGTVWSAFDRNQVAVFVATNALSPAQLLRYTQQLCGAPISTGPNSPTDGVPANDWTCVTGGPTQWSLTIYHFPQHGQTCYQTISEAIASLPPGVQSIVPPGVSVNTSTCGITGIEKAPPGAVAFVRCSFPDGSSSSSLTYDPSTITDGPDPIRNP